MKKTVMFTMLFLLTNAAAASPAEQPQTGFWAGVKSSMEKHLGRPYVWGTSGLKSFDCSGYLWRVMYENGVLMKRTTARKFYMMLKPVSNDENRNLGTVVFFDNLKHVGIVDDAESFYHARVSAGTTRSEMNSFWRKRIYGFRRFPSAP